MRAPTEAETVTTVADDRLHFAGFDVAFRGRSVDVIVLPRATDEPPPTVDAIVAALKRTPLERAPLDLIGRALEAAVDQASEVRIPVGQVSVTADEPGAPCAIVLSADALAAYAVPATQMPRPQPPTATDAATAPLEAGSMQAPVDLVEPAIMAIAAAPRVASASLLRRMLETAKVTVGILDGAVDAFGMGAPLTRITCLALGQAPVAGVDGTLEYHFDRSPRLNPRHREDGSVDFRAMLVERFVATDAVLVTRHPVVPELPGQNVLGDRLLAPAAKDVALALLAGEHTAVRGDELVATIGGRPMPNAAGRIDIVPVYEVAGDLNYSVGNIDFPGDVIVRGDVRSGFAIAATGSVVVQGLVESATITAGQDLTVMGVVGERWSVFTVQGDLTAQYLHTTEAHVGGSVVVAREVMNCRIDAERLTMAATGRLVGGTVTVRAGIDAGAIGAANGTLTEVTVSSRAPSAVIRARRSAHAGVVIRVGGARHELADELIAVSFWDVAGILVTLRAAADEQEVIAAQAQPGAA